MLERFIALRKHLNDILLVNPTASPLLSRAELQLIKEILAPLEQITKQVSGQQYIVASPIIPLIHCLEAKLDFINVSNDAADFKESVSEEISKRFAR